MIVAAIDWSSGQEACILVASREGGVVTVVDCETMPCDRDLLRRLSGVLERYRPAKISEWPPLQSGGVRLVDALAAMAVGRFLRGLGVTEQREADRWSVRAAEPPK